MYRRIGPSRSERLDMPIVASDETFSESRGGVKQALARPGGVSADQVENAASETQGEPHALEDLEGSNEDLRTSNEEMMSVNEEIQGGQ